MPVITSHSVIDNPDPVNLVMPPSITCTSNIKMPINTQFATARELFCANGFSMMPAKVAQEQEIEHEAPV